MVLSETVTLLIEHTVDEISDSGRTLRRRGCGGTRRFGRIGRCGGFGRNAGGRRERETTLKERSEPGRKQLHHDGSVCHTLLFKSEDFNKIVLGHASQPIGFPDGEQS